MTAISLDELVVRVLASGLLTAEQLDAVDVSPAASAEEMARVLVRSRLLTPFQARSLLAGDPVAFFVTERYKVLEHLGRGGMGEVYMVEHLLLRRVVAMKIITPADTPSGGVGAVDRFFREARAVAALDHPNVVRVFDMDRTPQGPFLVMEYVDGSNLHAVVNKSGPLAVERAVDAVRQAAAGLGHAHAAGLVHRDVKPGNLLLDRMGTVKVVDLGLARYRDAALNAGLTGMHDDNRVIGTADFQAPEQGLDSGSADSRSDVYGLGATLYYLLTGQVPFPDGTLANKLLAHQMKPPPNPAEANPAVPRELAGVVMRMMAKRPVDRPQSMAEVRAVLARWQEDELAPPPADEMPRHPPSAYRLGLCPPPSGASAVGFVGGPVAASAGDTPRTMRTAPASQRMPRPNPPSLVAPRGPLTQRLPKSNVPAPPPPPEQPVELPEVPVELADPDPPPPPSRRGLLVGLGVGLGALATVSGGGLVWWLNNQGVVGPPTRPVPPVPPSPPVPPAEVLEGSGSSFVKEPMRVWAEAYASQAQVTIKYTPTGSGPGISSVLSGLQPFCCSELLVTPEQAAKANRELADILHVPLAFGPLAVVYHLGDLKGPLTFTPEALGGIFAGEITTWNHPAIQDANPGVNLPAEKITVVHRSDDSGSTFVLMDYLCRAAKDVFPKAVAGGQPSESWAWTGKRPHAVAANKSDEMVKRVQETPYRIGYVDYVSALKAKLSFGRVRNRAGLPIEPSLTAVTTAAKNKSDSIGADLRFSLVDAPGDDSYPICSASWAVLFADQRGKPRGEALKQFLLWVIEDGQRLLGQVQFAELPKAIVAKAKDLINTMKTG